MIGRSGAFLNPTWRAGAETVCILEGLQGQHTETDRAIAVHARCAVLEERTVFIRWRASKQTVFTRYCHPLGSLISSPQLCKHDVL